MIDQVDKQTILNASIRHKAFKEIRSFFDQRDFLEIDAPILLEANAVEAQIDPLETTVHDLNGRSPRLCYLSTSPEIHMKRLLARGVRRLYSLGHVFRDREESPIHRTEFMMLEWYRAYADLHLLIEDCEILFSSLACILRTSGTADHHIQTPFDRISIASAWERFAQIDLESVLIKTKAGNPYALCEAVLRSGESLRENADFDDAFTHIMLKKIEPNIGIDRPCVLFDWPFQTAALAQLCPNNSLFAQRFEIYYRGIELANAFSELNDPIEQRARFEAANQVRIADNRSSLPIDENFLVDLSKMPPSCGIAVGIDRLLAVICDHRNLGQILCIPN